MPKSTPHRFIDIPYCSRDFPPCGVTNGNDTLEVWPEELLWAAITVGRANFLDVLSHGRYSEYELIYRVSMVLANLTRTHHNQVQKSPAFVHLDPSEKGAISYFLGLSVCKLFADRLLNVPWVLHYDVYRNLLPVVSHGRNRLKPDLIGRTRGGDWVILESKGRTNGFAPNLLVTGKQQTRSIRSVAGRLPKYRTAAVTHFAAGVLSFDWIDPEGYDEDAIDLATTPEEFFSLYYKLIYNILSNNETIEREGFRFYRFTHLGLTIGLRTDIYELYEKKLLSQIQPEEARELQAFPGIEDQLFYIGTDGIAVGIDSAVRAQLRQV